MTTRLRIVVTGREGQVAQSLVERGALHDDLEIVTLGRPYLDLGTPKALRDVVRAARPDAIVSAAAYTAVDQAETEEELASVINGQAPGELAAVAAELGVPILHLSTDYVFDGSKPSAYIESDPVAPVSAYGRSKLAGERAIAEATQNHAILRTAWVHSPFGKNFLKTMLRLGKDRDNLNVVADQVGTPTSALDIADAVIAIAKNMIQSADPALRGVFHLTNAGKASWADFAEEIFRASKEVSGPSATVNRIPSSQYPTPAKRPANSQLDCTLLREVHGVQLPDWTVSTRSVVVRVLDGQSI